MMKHFTTVPRSIAVDITETEQQYVVTGDVPGCEKDDVDVELDDDNILTISVKKESKVEEDLAPESAEDSEAKEDKDVSAAGVKSTGGTKWVEQDQKVANTMDGKSSTRAQQRQPCSNVQNSHAPPMQPEGTKWIEQDGNLASAMDGKSSTKAQQRQPSTNMQKSHAPPMQLQHDSSSDEIDDDIEIINKSSIY